MNILKLCIILAFACLSGRAPERIIARYIGHQYTKTKNSSFINDRLIFVDKNDTIIFNIKWPVEEKQAEILNYGLFYNCHLKADTFYTFTLKKICLKDIPKEYNSYYNTNAIFDGINTSKFIEIKKNTRSKYSGNYGKFIDRDGILYEIIGLKPDGDCFLQH